MSEAQRKSAGSLVRRPLLAAALAASAVVPAPAMAAYDAFLKLDNLMGESSADKWSQWIEVSSFGIGIENAVANNLGAGRSAGKATCSPLTLMKNVDRSSPKLFAAALTGSHFQKADLEVVRTGATTAFLKYELQDLIVTSIDEGSAAGSRPAENLSLNYGKVTVSYYLQNADGKLNGDPTSTATIDCTRNSAQ